MKKTTYYNLQKAMSDFINFDKTTSADNNVERYYFEFHNHINKIRKLLVDINFDKTMELTTDNIVKLCEKASNANLLNKTII